MLMAARLRWLDGAGLSVGLNVGLNLGLSARRTIAEGELRATCRRGA
jgi:hypothetical protein